MTKHGAAYLAASFLTTRHVDAVAGDYIDWIDGQDRENVAIDALLAASRVSKNPAKVLAAAAARYDEFDPLIPEEDPEPPVQGGDD